MTSINKYMLKQLPEDLTNPIKHEFTKFIEKYFSEFRWYSERSNIYSLNCLHDISLYLDKLMHDEKATAWNMLPIFEEFKILLDKCNTQFVKECTKDQTL